MYSNGPPHMDELKQDDQLEHTYSSYVRIRDVVLKTCRRRWTIGRSDERGSVISVLTARHDDDDDEWKKPSHGPIYKKFHLRFLIGFRSGEFAGYVIDFIYHSKNKPQKTKHKTNPPKKKKNKIKTPPPKKNKRPPPKKNKTKQNKPKNKN